MKSKNLNEQLKDLEEILFKNETLKEVLKRIEKSNVKNYYEELDVLTKLSLTIFTGLG
mgnify:FL=1